ncbi:GldG family protein [bacterium]|nr:GldG family protein [bacterium]
MFKSVSYTVLIVVFVLSLAMALNIISSKVHKRWDITDEKEFSLSSATKNILSKLDDILTIQLYYSNDLPPILHPIQQQIADLIEEIKATATQTILIENIAPDLNEETEQEAIALGIAPLELNIKEKDKIELKKVFMGMALYYQDKKEVIPIVVQVNNLEYQLSLSLLKLTQGKLPRIGLYVGSNRDQYSSLKEIISQIAQLVPIEGDESALEDKNLAALVIVDPVEIKDTFAEQLENLALKGTNIILFTANVTISNTLIPQKVSSGLEDWLKEKNIIVSEQLLIDASQNMRAAFNTGMLQVYIPYVFWARTLKHDLNRDHPITALIEEVLFPWSNALLFNTDKESVWTPLELIHSSKTSFLQPEDIPDVSPEYYSTMTKTPRLQELPLSVVLTHSKNKTAGKIFITSTHHLVQDRFLTQAPSNPVFLSNMLEYSSWGNELINIRSRGKTTRPIKHLVGNHKTAIKWGHTAGIPGLAVFLGVGSILVGRQRRKRFIKKLSQ